MKLACTIIWSTVLVCFLGVTANSQIHTRTVPIGRTLGGRIERSLNTGWRFQSDDVKGAERRDLDDSSWQKISVPHTWNNVDAFDETPGYRRGASWYRRDLAIGQELAGKTLVLYFEGANQVAEVFVNGRFVGRHIGGYTAFSFDITSFVEVGRKNVVAVRVDNSFNENIAPLTADFNMYGGIYRDVRLIAVDKLHFKTDDLASSGIQITTPNLSAASGTVMISSAVTNNSGHARSVDLESRVIDAAGRTVASVLSKVSVETGGAQFANVTPPIPTPHLWSPGDPYLYSVRTVLREKGKILDSITEPLGFRWFRFDAENGFFLNGKPLKLRGTNRHQDYAGLGNALPDRLHVRDMELIKDNGFNFVRLAHYPQDPSVLDAADRLGILLWEEIPIVNYINDSKAFADNSETMLREMIRQHRDHPSVITWGYMNEIFLRVPKGRSDLYPATVRLARELNRIAHEEDPTRVTTIALHGSEIYNTTGLADVPDVVGWNIYKGWYGGEMNEFGTFMDDQHRRYPKRPLIISEYGANGDQRMHSAKPRRFDSTTEYQRRFHESYLSQIDARPYIAGSAIWSQFDFGSELRGETRPHINQKGMFTADRRPKDVSYFYKAALSPEPVVHIVNSDQKYRSGTAGTSEQVDVYTNLASAGLVVNGVSLGTKPSNGERKLSWTRTLRDGANVVVARGGRNGAAVIDRSTIFYKAVSAASPDIAVNVGSNASYTDAESVVWLADRAYSTGGWGYVGKDAKFIYEADGDRDIIGTNEDGLFQSMQEGLSAYRFDVPPGQYSVELSFAETKVTAPGKRVFNVKINAETVVDDLDLFKTVGKDRAYTKSANVRAAKGGIVIEFIAIEGRPIVSAIRVRRSPDRR